MSDARASSASEKLQLPGQGDSAGAAMLENDARDASSGGLRA
ncbi:hypothetical protein LJR290_003419 [Variovorax sp. LjRoot290]